MPCWQCPCSSHACLCAAAPERSWKNFDIMGGINIARAVHVSGSCLFGLVG